MKNKLPFTIRLIFIATLLVLIVGLLTTISVQSADPLSINANPTLTLVKSLTIDNGGTASATDWTLSATGPTTISGTTGSPSVTNAVVDPGTYTLSESTISGYTQTSLTCDDNPSVQVTSVTLGLDQNVTCTFVNDDDAPSLKLAKNVTKDNGGTAVASDWTLYAGTDSVTGSETAVEVTDQAGTYSLTESSVAGYSLTSLTCDDNPSVQVTEVTIGLGETITCTFVNDDDAPSLKLAKNVTKDNGGTAVASDWTLYAGTDSVTGSETAVEVTDQAGTYALTESSVAGYSLTSLTCDDNPSVQVTEVTIGLGETITCTFVNDDIAPSLTVIKNVVNDNGGSFGASNFTINVTGTDVSLPSFPGAVSPGTTVTLDAGSYSVGETDVIGYFDSYSTDCSGTIGIGETKTCTITNDDVGFNITPTSGLLTSESGVPTDTFTVVLDTPPANNVTLSLASSNTDEGTIDKSSLTFTTSNWFNSQQVTVTGVEDDGVADGDQPYTIVTGPVTSLDTDYSSLNPGTIIPDVSVINSDNDTPGYTITPNTDLWVSEGGKTETIQVLLKSKPTSLVTLSAESSDTDEGTISIENAIVNPIPWPQTTPTKITITGVDDCTTGGGSLTLTINADSSDLNYNGTVAVLPVTNYDAPTIGWVEPVETGDTYDSDGLSPINLEVESLCPEPIQKVRFYRWVEALGANVTIGEDLTPPYQEILQPSELQAGYNQISAFAFSPTDPQTFSEHKYIFITKDYNNLILLPLVNK